MDKIRFGTDGWRATLDSFTVPRVRKVGQAIADYLTEYEQPAATVAIGYDARESSRDFAEEISRVLCNNSHSVLFPTRDIPTPVLAWNIVAKDLHGGIMITASHNPPNYNGIKFIPSTGAPALPAVTSEIEHRLGPPTNSQTKPTGTVTETSFVEPYCTHLHSLVPTDLTGLSVAYDAMHGSGREILQSILQTANATVEPIRCTRDPTFGGTPPEPSKENLSTLRKTVQDDFDIGIATDGDADRIAIVTPEHGYINGHLFFALLYDYLLETKTGPAVRTVSTTYLIDKIAQHHGENVIETPVGFKWIAEQMQEHNALFGGEESGGYSIRGHVPEKDGILMGLLACAATVDQSLDSRLDSLQSTHGLPVQDKISIDCPDHQKTTVLDSIGDAIPDSFAGGTVGEVNDLDGFKIQLADGSWVLFRPSGTEPKIRVYAESSSEDQCKNLLETGRNFVLQFLS